MAKPLPAIPTPVILVVEDDLHIAALLVEILGANGFATIATSTAAAAIGILVTEPVDLVLSDVGLPDASGFEVLAAVHAHGLSVPVVLMTASPTPRDRRRAARNQAMAYLVKPIPVHLLLAAIRNALAGTATIE